MPSRSRKKRSISNSADSKSEEQKFLNDVTKQFKEHAPDFSATINITLIGKVSTGKSSLLNAILRRTRENPAVNVGATSGVTTSLECFRLHDQFLIVDSPGLGDVIAENSRETNEFLKHVDLGVLVVTGSADSTQKKHYDDLRHHAKKVVVVLNKVDEWDDLEASALEDVLAQWRQVLEVDVIYPTVTKGFDPKSKTDSPLILKGVDEVRKEIEDFFQEEGKDVIFAHQMGDKTPCAIGYISLALVAVAIESFISGSAVYITATQALAIAKLYYLYYGRALTLTSALAALPSFAAKSLGMTVFLWAKSVLPTTGIVDAAAAGIAVTITLAMLSTVTFMFAKGYELNQKDVLQGRFSELKGKASKLVMKTDIADMKNAAFWQNVILDFLT